MTTGTQATATAIAAGSAWDSTDDGDVEQHQSGRRDSGEPQPLATAGTHDVNSCDATQQHQQRRRGIADGLGGEQGSVTEDL